MLIRPIGALLLALAILLAAACGGAKSDAAPAGDGTPGKALEPVQGVWHRVTAENPFGPGQTVVAMRVPAINISDSPITIRRIEPLLAARALRVARVRGIGLATRKGGQRAFLPLGTYQTYPPRAATVDGCLTERVMPAAGYVLRPRRHPWDFAILVIRIRTLAPGTFRMRGQRVVYEQDGELHYQDLLVGISISVRAGAKRPLAPWESACRT